MADNKRFFHKEHKAHVAMAHHKSMDHLKVKKVLSFNTTGKGVCGCDITTEGKILLTDYYKERCLMGFDQEGTHLFNVSLDPYDAFDVACIDETTVAVTSGEHKVISVVNIGSHTVDKHIITGHDCYGVTYIDGTLLVCAKGHGIISIILESEEVSTIVQCSLPTHSYITSFEDRLFYTNWVSRTVTCSDMEGNDMWTFHDTAILLGPRGLNTDKEGRVYVCDSVKDRVVVLSNDGKKSKIILSEDDGIDEPYAIKFDKETNNLVVANEEETCFFFHVL